MVVLVNFCGAFVFDYSSTHLSDSSCNKRDRVNWEDAASKTFHAHPPDAALGVAFCDAYEAIGEMSCIRVYVLVFQRGYEQVRRAAGISLRGPVMTMGRAAIRKLVFDGGRAPDEIEVCQMTIWPSLSMRSMSQKESLYGCATCF